MTAEEMAKIILELVIRKRGGVSFVEIMEAAGEEGKGDLAWELVPNVMLWSGMSQTLIDAMDILRSKIAPTPTHYLVYLVDGAAMPGPSLRLKEFGTLIESSTEFPFLPAALSPAPL